MSPLPHFATGEPLGAAEANLIARQGVITVATLADRDTLPAPHDGMVCYVEADETIYLYVRGQWRVHYAAPRPYVPTFINLSPGNATLTAEWSQNGDVVHWWVRLVIGSTTSITGLITLILPKPAHAATATPDGATSVGTLLVRDVSASGAASRRYYNVISDYTVDPLRAWPLGEDGLGPNASLPWAWAAGDSLDWQGTYRAAD